MNTRMIFRTAAASVAALALALTTTLYAQPGHRSGKMERGEKMEKMAEKLNLTEQQKTQIKALRDNFKKEHEAQLSEMKSLHEQMRGLKGSGDTEQAKQLREKMKTAKQALQTDREKLQQQISALLTPEQRQQFEQHKAERKEHHEQKKGERKGKRQQGVTGEGKKIE
ncbi:MAG: Spy/CpxP family protein refolding chaperone [Chlorobi bacterium]|nr:Spy/CpxP family protein refolding chaperone [Chlorobiota bacterium]